MTQLFSDNVYTFGTSSALHVIVSYDKKRQGADMLYQFYYKIFISDRKGSLNPYGTYQNPVKATFTLNGNNVWEKITQGNQGWSFEYTSDWIIVSNKTSGTTPFKFTIKDTINTGWCNYTSSTYSLVVDPAGSDIGAVANFNIGNAITVPITKYASMYDVLVVKIGSTTIKTINNASSPTTITFTSSELNTIYNLTTEVQSTIFTFELTTYEDSSKATIVGTTKSTTARGYIVGSYPLINSITFEDTNSTTTALTGDSSTMVRYMSNVKVSVSASGVNKATIKSITINNTTASSGIVTFNSASSNSFEVKVVDSRGFTTTQTETMPMIDYVPLTLSANVYRDEPTNGKVVIDYSGNYFSRSFGGVSNTLTVQYRYIEKGGSWDNVNWITLNPNIYSNNTYEQVITIEGFDYQKQYVFQVRATDKLSSPEPSVANITKGKPIFNWDENNFNVNGEIKKNGNPIFQSINWSETYDYNTLTKSGVYYAGVNCANAPAVYCKVLVMGSTDTNYGDVSQLAISIGTPNIYIRTRNNTNWSSWKLMVDRESIFPVGSIYMSVTNTNPSNSFGGTWVLIGQGRTIVGVDTSQTEFNAPEKTGGEKISSQIATGSSQYGFTPSSPSGYNDRTLVSVKSFGIPHDEQNANISLVQPYITCYIWKRTK